MPNNNDLKTNNDFSGYVTRYNVKCKDGRFILPGAFKHMDGSTVPLVWEHNYDSPGNILGKIYLEERSDGVYGYASFNTTKNAEDARAVLIHGGFKGLSIYAVNVREKKGEDKSNVSYGDIREASMVISAANPGAYIDHVNILHGESVYTPDGEYYLEYIDEEGLIPTASISPDKTANKNFGHSDPASIQEEPQVLENTEGNSDEEITEEEKAMEMLMYVKKYLAGVITKEELDAYLATLPEDKQNAIKDLLAVMAEQPLATSTEQDVSVDPTVQHSQGVNMTTKNVFENDVKNATESAITFSDFKRDLLASGSMRETILRHSGTYGFNNIGVLFPEYKEAGPAPIIINRLSAWVDSFYNNASKTPFSRVKTTYIDLTPENIRARGYVTGSVKIEHVIELLKRTTDPATVYIKQRMDRDDLIDMEGFETIQFLEKMMENNLIEEIARAGLVGDGRLAGDPNKIDETHIRPIYNDHPFYAHRVVVPATTDGSPTTLVQVIDEATRGMEFYRGSGNPILYTTPQLLATMLTMRNPDDRDRYYGSVQELAAQFLCRDIIPTSAMEGLKRSEGGVDYGLVGIMVNPADYVFGSNKGGQKNWFEDFDINVNQQAYLMEARLSGALTLPKSALVIEWAGWTSAVRPPLPTNI